ncbi:MAG TPA: hypothetical protein VMW56_10105 [Candidatus Margulisiibacteriota bacterium]|nr:hypothetical protein [Candidatus Margulisiibacteriota bacterium]
MSMHEQLPAQSDFGRVQRNAIVAWRDEQVPRSSNGKEQPVMAGGKTFKRDQKRRKEMARKLKQEEKLRKKMERREAKKVEEGVEEPEAPPKLDPSIPI